MHQERSNLEEVSVINDNDYITWQNYIAEIHIAINKKLLEIQQKDKNYSNFICSMESFAYVIDCLPNNCFRIF